MFDLMNNPSERQYEEELGPNGRQYDYRAKRIIHAMPGSLGEAPN